MTAIDREFKRQQFLRLKEAADNGKLVPPKRKGFTRKVRQAVFERQQGICARCGEWLSASKFEVDHVLERDLMGSNGLDNLEALHPACHQVKTSARAPVLAKTHRLADATFEPPKEKAFKLQGRSFDKSLTKKLNGTVVRRYARPDGGEAIHAETDTSNPGMDHSK